MKEFSVNQINFLKNIEEGRLASSHDDIPHVKPVSILLVDNQIVVATDYETRTFQNIKKNPRIAISIDIYNPGSHKSILVQGKAELIENGSEFKKIYEKFYDKFAWVRKEPWKDNEAPFIKIIPKYITSWGI